VKHRLSERAIANQLALRRRYYRDNKELERKRNRSYYKRNRKKILGEYRRRYSEDPYVYRLKEVRRKYGITEEEYEALKKKQKNRCAICGKRPVGRYKELAVDHDHKTRRVRGLLCTATCNRIIGMMKEDPKLLLKAIRYLRKHA
jgi:hypothetical protein